MEGMVDWKPIKEIECALKPSPNVGSREIPPSTALIDALARCSDKPPPSRTKSKSASVKNDTEAPTSLSEPDSKPKRKGLGCGQGCLVLGIAAFCGFLLILVYGAAHEGDPQSNVVITGATARCHLEILSENTPELAGETVAEEVYKVAVTYPQLAEIDIELELLPAGGSFVDSYGHTVPGPYIMGTLPVNDLGEVRKYATAGSFGIAVQDAYAIRIMRLSYANFLKQDQ